MIDNIIYKNVDNVKLAFIQKDGYKTKQAMVCLNYGSCENNIIVDNEKINLPSGIAHFLEHKMFEHKEKNAFEVFNKLGASVNAYTNLTSTAYYFECADNFNECFCELLDLVSTPYFTDENVEKEKGIIAQEIKMYDDDPYWRVFFNLIKAMYDDDNPITKDIAGSVSDIKKIDAKMLYTCYNNFYTKDNAIIVCCGDIGDINKIEQIITKKLKLNSEKKGKIQHYEEKNKEKEKKVNQKMEIKQKIFNIGFKDELICDKMEKKVVCNRILLDIMFGKSSSFYKRLYDYGTIDNSFGFDFNYYRDASFHIFSGTGDNFEKISEEILKEVDAFIQNGVEKSVFERIKNKQIGQFVSRFDMIDSIITMEADFFSKGFSIKQYYEALLNIELKDIIKSVEKFGKQAYISTII